MRKVQDQLWELVGCSGKKAFDSAKMAKEVAKRRSRRGRKGTAYRCAICRYWHIGSRPGIK